MRLLTAAWYHSYNIDGGRSLSSASEHSTQFNCRRSLYTLNIQYIVLKLYLLFQSFEYLFLSLSPSSGWIEKREKINFGIALLSLHTHYMCTRADNDGYLSQTKACRSFCTRAQKTRAFVTNLLRFGWKRYELAFRAWEISHKKKTYICATQSVEEISRDALKICARERDARNDDGWCDFELQMLWNEAHLWVWRGNGILYLFKVASNVYT